MKRIALGLLTLAVVTVQAYRRQARKEALWAAAWESTMAERHLRLVAAALKPESP